MDGIRHVLILSSIPVWSVTTEENQDRCRKGAILWVKVLTLDFRNTKQQCHTRDRCVRLKLSVKYRSAFFTFRVYTVTCVSCAVMHAV